MRTGTGAVFQMIPTAFFFDELTRELNEIISRLPRCQLVTCTTESICFFSWRNIPAGQLRYYWFRGFAIEAAIAQPRSPESQGPTSTGRWGIPRVREAKNRRPPRIACHDGSRPRVWKNVCTNDDRCSKGRHSADGPASQGPVEARRAQIRGPESACARVTTTRRAPTTGRSAAVPCDLACWCRPKCPVACQRT